jgi:hypothetical protein
MVDCWRVLNGFFNRPRQFAEDLMAEITAIKKIQVSEYERLFEYYIFLWVSIREAKRADLFIMLLHPQNLVIIESALPPR